MPLDLVKLHYLEGELKRPFQVIQSEVTQYDPTRVITCSNSTFTDVESTLELIGELIDVENDIFICSTKQMVSSLQKYLSLYNKTLKHYICGTSGRITKTAYNTAYMLDIENNNRLSSNITAKTIVKV